MKASDIAVGIVRGPANMHVAWVPDRFGPNKQKYKGKSFSDASLSIFMNGGSNNAGDLTRYYFLAMVCDLVEKEKLQGDIAELGVYRGHTAFMLTDLARRMGKTAWLIDTFEGFPVCDCNGIDHKYLERVSDYNDTGVSTVADVVGDGAKFIKGYFPHTADQIPAGTKFVMVHLDCDLYAPMKAGLAFFYPRLISGGFLIMHDYSSLFWDGAERAVDEFFADKPEKIIPIPDKSGRVVIRKQ